MDSSSTGAKSIVGEPRIPDKKSEKLAGTSTTLSATLPETLSGNVRARSASATPLGKNQESKAGKSKASELVEGLSKSNTPPEAAAPEATAPPATVPAASHPLLRARPFIIKANLLRPASSASKIAIAEVTASILSQTFDKPNVLSPPVPAGSDVSGVKLSQLRKLIPPMSRFPKVHEFCTSDGDPISNEAISLAEYLELVESSSTPNVVGIPVTPASTESPLSASDTSDSSTSDPTEPATNAPTPTAPAPPKTISARSVGVIQVYYKSPLAHRMTASQQRAGASIAPPELHGVGMTQYNGPQLEKAGSTEAQNQAMNAQMAEFRAEHKAAEDAKATTINAGNLTEMEWGTVLRNCAVFYGWIVDPSTKAIRRAPKPAFQLRSAVFGLDKPAPSQTISNAIQAQGTADVNGSKDLIALPTQLTPLDISEKEAPQKTDSRIPNYRINDDSKIDITICKHELALSMARNDFNSQSTEASVSGGAFGVTVGVSAGYAKSESSSNKQFSSETMQTMVARYMFPRCDLLLVPDDLEPSPELAALVEKIRVGKNIRDLRKLQQDFGQLFCQQVTLGARLLSTRSLKTNVQTSEAEQKEQFKVSVGVTVSTPYVGASVKHEQEKGSGTASSQSRSDSIEVNVFEAVGGDTILANNPAAWTASVAASGSWRIINRDGLSSLVGMLSEIPLYSEVQSWFVQAVPALSRFVTLDESKKVTCRFRVQSPTNDLSRSGRTSSNYLCYHPGDTCQPAQGSLDMTVADGVFVNLWKRHDIYKEKLLFDPERYRAPVIRGFDDYEIGNNAQYGTAYNDSFASVNWDVIAPFPENLAHGSRIILRTKPRDDTTQVAHMVVMRNAQGEFLPAVSACDGYQYWRIVKASNNANDGDPIQRGDEVRFCWRPTDQTAGFRDFVDDSFGRRRFTPPEEIASKDLYLKIPWPRFEDKWEAVGMIMSADPGQDTKPTLVKTKQNDKPYVYFMQDLKFRIDPVDNDGRGDSEDYMLKGVPRASNGSTEPWWAQMKTGSPLTLHAAIWQFGILPTFRESQALAKPDSEDSSMPKLGPKAVVSAQT